MAKITVELTTEEVHSCELAIGRTIEHMPDQTPKERAMLKGLQEKLWKAYVKADCEDFNVSHLI